MLLDLNQGTGSASPYSFGFKSYIMAPAFRKLSGYSLLIGSSLMVLTMLLHPSGGDIQHILQISRVAIISHSLGILSTVFTAYGFYGLASAIMTQSRISFLGLSFAGFALVAVLLAALLNGLVLPMYVMQQSGIAEENLEMVKLIINYGITINAALDYVFIAGYSIAMLIWSIGMLRAGKFSNWLGIWGITLVGISVAAALFQLNFISVTGFTVYVIGIVSWIVSAAIILLKKPLQ
jgi:hypothetical protein